MTDKVGYKYVRKKRYGAYAWVLECIPEDQVDTEVNSDESTTEEMMNNGVA